MLTSHDASVMHCTAAQHTTPQHSTAQHSTSHHSSTSTFPCIDPTMSLSSMRHCAKRYLEKGRLECIARPITPTGLAPAQISSLACEECCGGGLDVLPLQMSLKKGGADENVPKALRYLLATPQEVKEVEEQSQTTSQWLADILEYRRLPTPMTPFDYITLSDATELKVQEASSQTANMPCIVYCACCRYWQGCLVSSMQARWLKSICAHTACSVTRLWHMWLAVNIQDSARQNATLDCMPVLPCILCRNLLRSPYRHCCFCSSCVRDAACCSSSITWVPDWLAISSA